MGYKIFASDLDGTLLDSNGGLSEESLLAIRELSARGVFFVPASGRSLSEIPSILRNEKSIRFYIHSSGAGIYDKQTDKNLSLGLPLVLSSEVLRYAFDIPCHVTVRSEGKMLTSPDGLLDDVMKYYNVWSAHKELLLDCGEAVSDFNSRMLRCDKVDMISLFFHDDKTREALRDKLLSFDELNVASACPYNIEITFKQAGKGNALLLLAEIVGIEKVSTLAVGDSENDIPMIISAGLGLATQNAADSVKAAADGVVCSNDEGFANFILKKYF